MLCLPVWNLPLGGMSGGVSGSPNRTETTQLHKGLLLVGVAACRCLWRCLLTDKPTCHACHGPGPVRICHPCHPCTEQHSTACASVSRGSPSKSTPMQRHTGRRRLSCWTASMLPRLPRTARAYNTQLHARNGVAAHESRQQHAQRRINHLCWVTPPSPVIASPVVAPPVVPAPVVVSVPAAPVAAATCTTAQRTAAGTSTQRWAHG